LADAAGATHRRIRKLNTHIHAVPLPAVSMTVTILDVGDIRTAITAEFRAQTFSTLAFNLISDFSLAYGHRVLA
jgi:hypothetical protein